MTAPMQWRRLSETAMRCEPWTVAKAVVRGKPLYELWHDKRPEMIGPFPSFDAAKAEAERMEGEGQG